MIIELFFRTNFNIATRQSKPLNLAHPLGLYADVYCVFQGSSTQTTAAAIDSSETIISAQSRDTSADVREGGSDIVTDNPAAIFQGSSLGQNHERDPPVTIKVGKDERNSGGASLCAGLLVALSLIYYHFELTLQFNMHLYITPKYNRVTLRQIASNLSDSQFTQLTPFVHLQLYLSNALPIQLLTDPSTISSTTACPLELTNQSIKHLQCHPGAARPIFCNSLRRL